jgi:hypothetical protein
MSITRVVPIGVFFIHINTVGYYIRVIEIETMCPLTVVMTEGKYLSNVF